MAVPDIPDSGWRYRVPGEAGTKERQIVLIGFETLAQLWRAKSIVRSDISASRSFGNLPQNFQEDCD